MKFLRYSIQTLFTLALLGVVGLFALPFLPIDTNVELRIVQSGSMEPAISTGSLILVWPQTSYSMGDVIMFEDRNASVPTTHRIVGTVEGASVTRFVTQGDANEDPDNVSVATGDIYGAVAFSLPKAGFVLDFARQPVGFMLLIVLPALLLIIGEIKKIWKELRRRPVEVVQEVAEPIVIPSTKPDPIQSTNTTRISSSKMMDIMTPVRFHLGDTLDLRGAKLTFAPRKFSLFTPGTVSMIVGAFGIMTAVLATQYWQLGSTYSYFTDAEMSEDNRVQSIALDFSAVADGEQFTFLNGQLLDDVDGSVVTTVMPIPSSEPTLHSVSIAYVSGSELFCDAIAVGSDEPVLFDGSLTSLSGTDIVFDQPWLVSFTLPDESGLVDGDTCNVEIVLSAWHIDQESGGGYSDEERVPLTFSFSSPTSFTTSFTVPLRTENKSLTPLSQSALVVDVEEEAKPQEVITDEGLLGDSDNNSITDTEDNDSEIKPEDVMQEDIKTEDADEEKASDEADEEKYETNEDNSVVEEVEEEIGGAAIAAENSAEAGLVEESDSETEEVQVEEESEEGVTEEADAAEESVEAEVE